MLVIETLGAPAPPTRRRRQPTPVGESEQPAQVPLTRATAVAAHRPFASAHEAGAWLEQTSTDEDALAALLWESAALLNRAIHAAAVARADPRAAEIDIERALVVRIGYGSGEEVAAGRFAEAREVDVRGGRSRRRHREDELRPQERIAAVLGSRERLDVCETLLLRSRADLDAGRLREAALQLQIGLRALLLELPAALKDPGHEEDMATLEARRGQADAAAETALHTELNPESERTVRDLLALSERVLRRRRVLRG